MKKIILTHYDLDGAVSAIMAKTAIPDAAIDFLNYTSVEKTIEGVVVDNFGEDLTIFVLDFRLGLKYIERLLSFQEFRVCLIDHHVIEDVEMETMIKLRDESGGRFFFKHDTSMAAAQLSYNYFSKYVPMPHLAELARLTDIYDCWRQENPDFKAKAIHLNEIFWKMREWKFIDEFSGGYKIDAECEKIIAEFEAKRERYMDKVIAEHSCAFTLDSGRSVLFLLKPEVEYINLFTVYYPQFSYYFILKNRDKETKASHVSVRLRGDCPTSIQEIAEEFVHSMPEVTGGGHKYAGGFVYPERIDIESFFEMAAEIVAKIDEKYK